MGTFLFNAHTFEVETAVRYTAPVLIAGLPATMLLLSGTAEAPPAQRIALRTGSGAALLIVVVLFSGPLMQRVEVAVTARTLLSYPVSAFDGNYIARALGSPARRWVREAQMSTEEGATILAWTSVPFQLDFRRNRILSVREHGLVNPWLRLPIGEEPRALRQYLRAHGVRYVFLQYAGPGMSTDRMLEGEAASPDWLRRHIGEAGLRFRKSLLALAAESRPIWSAPQAILYEVPER